MNSERLVKAALRDLGRLWQKSFAATIAVAALATCLGGCRRDSSADLTPSSDSANHRAPHGGTPDDKANVHAPGSTGDPSANLIDTGPPPKFVGFEMLTTQFPDKTPQTRRRVKRFSDNTTKNDGPFTEWSATGQVVQDGQYVDGVRDGDWKLYYENGKPCKTEHYLHGKLDGSWTTWREDGTRERDVSFKAGERDGLWVTYDATGKKKLTAESYKADRRDGIWQTWFPSGQLQMEEHFRAGQLDGVQTAWYENGKKRSEQNFSNGERNGKQLYWKPSGEPLTEQLFDHGLDVTPKSPQGK